MYHMILYLPLSPHQHDFVCEKVALKAFLLKVKFPFAKADGVGEIEIENPKF